MKQFIQFTVPSLLGFVFEFDAKYWNEILFSKSVLRLFHDLILGELKLLMDKRQNLFAYVRHTFEYILTQLSLMLRLDRG